MSLIQRYVALFTAQLDVNIMWVECWYPITPRGSQWCIVVSVVFPHIMYCAHYVPSAGVCVRDGDLYLILGGTLSLGFSCVIVGGVIRVTYTVDWLAVVAWYSVQVCSIVLCWMMCVVSCQMLCGCMFVIMWVSVARLCLLLLSGWFWWLSCYFREVTG